MLSTKTLACAHILKGNLNNRIDSPVYIFKATISSKI
jgi:hypothetical protein